jgi:hypothetical protein
MSKLTDDAWSVPAAARARRTDWAALAAGGRAEQERIGHDALLGLPEPARRWADHAIAPGTPLWSSVLLTMRGQIRLGTWRRFTAREVLAPRGFIWSATARVAGLPLSGFDRHSSGAGEMRWSLFGIVPVMRASGVDVTRSGAGRLAGELVLWLPPALATATWSSSDSDPDTAVATWRSGDPEDAVQIRVDPSGRLIEFLMQRWGNPDGRRYARCPFGGRVEAEHTFDGVTIASRVRAGWWWGTDRQEEGEFFHAEITDAGFR